MHLSEIKVLEVNQVSETCGCQVNGLTAWASIMIRASIRISQGYGIDSTSSAHVKPIDVIMAREIIDAAVRDYRSKHDALDGTPDSPQRPLSADDASGLSEPKRALGRLRGVICSFEEANQSPKSLTVKPNTMPAWNWLIRSGLRFARWPNLSFRILATLNGKTGAMLSGIGIWNVSFNSKKCTRLCKGRGQRVAS